MLLMNYKFLKLRNISFLFTDVTHSHNIRMGLARLAGSGKEYPAHPKILYILIQTKER